MINSINGLLNRVNQILNNLGVIETHMDAMRNYTKGFVVRKANLPLSGDTGYSELSNHHAVAVVGDTGHVFEPVDPRLTG